MFELGVAQTFEERCVQPKGSSFNNSSEFTRFSLGCFVYFFQTFQKITRDECESYEISAHLLRFLSVAAAFTANSDIKLQRAIDDVMHGKLRNFCSPASLFLLSCFVHYSVANPFLNAIQTWNYNAQFMTWWSWVSVCWRILFWKGICFSNVFLRDFSDPRDFACLKLP